MNTKSDKNSKDLIAAIGLGLGGFFGMLGCFVPLEALRGLAWGIDGIALVIASSLLTIKYLRSGEEIVAAGFLVFSIAQALVLSGSAMSLIESAPIFGAGSGLWAAALVLISFSSVFPLIVRILGLITAILFAITAIQIFYGVPLDPQSEPLPFFAYPLLVVTLVGWIWTILRGRNQA